MKTVNRIIIEDLVPETAEERREIEQLIVDVANEKPDISKIQKIMPGQSEEDVFPELVEEWRDDA